MLRVWGTVIALTCASCAGDDQAAADAGADAAPDGAPDAPDAAACAAQLSCASIRCTNPAAASGMYTRPSDGHAFFCDMRGPVVQYDELATAAYDGAHPGYTLITGAALQDSVVQQAFATLFDRQQGILALEAWTIGNICMTTSASGGVRLELADSGGSTLVGLALLGSNAVVQGQAYGLHVGASRFEVQLPMDFFATHTPRDTTNVCADNANPALFFARTVQ